MAAGPQRRGIYARSGVGFRRECPDKIELTSQRKQRSRAAGSSMCIELCMTARKTRTARCFGVRRLNNVEELREPQHAGRSESDRQPPWPVSAPSMRACAELANTLARAPRNHAHQSAPQTASARAPPGPREGLNPPCRVGLRGRTIRPRTRTRGTADPRQTLARRELASRQQRYSSVARTSAAVRSTRCAGSCW
jgi:hypothetical protein